MATYEYQDWQKSAKISDATAAAHSLLTVDTNNTTNTVLVLKKAGAGERVVAVLKEAVTSANQVRPCHFLGHIVKCLVDGSGTAISEGDPIKSNGSAVGVKAASDQDSVMGIALAPSAASGDLIPVMAAHHDIGIT